MFPVVVPWRAAVLSFKAYKNNQMNSNILMLHPMQSLGADWLIAARTYPSFSSMKQLGVFLLPPEGMLVHCRSLPCNLLGFLNNLPVPIYTPGWRGTVRVKCLAMQEYNRVPSQGLNPDQSLQGWALWPWGHCASHMLHPISNIHSCEICTS